ncbi:hypothetical protein V2O64_12205 [Verrucomicrobiaceae bacterium 227]
MMKVWLKRLLKLFLILLLLFACAWWFENWRGARTWEKAQARAAAVGISLDPLDYQPPAVPDEENILTNRRFLNEWNGETKPNLTRWEFMHLPGTRERIPSQIVNPVSGQSLEFRKFFDGDLTEQEAVDQLTKASLVLQARLDQLADLILSYPGHPLLRHHFSEVEPFPQLGDLNSLPRLASCFRDQAVLNLRTGNPQGALRNILIIDRLARFFGSPTAFHHLVANSTRQFNQQIIWEGLRLRSWNEPQLNEILATTDHGQSFDALTRVLKLEMTNSLVVFNDLPQAQIRANQGPNFLTLDEPSLLEKAKNALQFHGPQGWTDQRKSVVVNGFLDQLENESLWSAQYLHQTKSGPEISTWSPFFMAQEGTAIAHQWIGIELKNQNSLRITRLAILLELHFLKHGSYPVSLNDLAGQPQVLDATDPKNRPFSYVLDSQGRPQIRATSEKAKAPSRLRFRWQYSLDQPDQERVYKKTRK